MISILVCLALVAPKPVTLPPLPSIHLPAFCPATVAPSLESFEELDAEYQAALASWKDQYANAEGRTERKRLRKSRPAAVFAPRFEQLAASGDGQALLWQVANLHAAGIVGKARDVKRTACYEALFASHIQADWFGGALTQFWSDRNRFEAEQVSAWLEQVRTTSKSNDLIAQPRYYADHDNVFGKTASAQKIGFAAYESLIADFPDSEWAKKAKTDLFVKRDRVIGAMAFDFTGTTVDGETFKLSDHRGKVVLLDFWGFW